MEAGSAAAKAGFQVGDVVTAIDGKAIGSFSDMQRVVGIRAGEQLTFTVKRGDTTEQLRGTPELREIKDPFGNAHRIGVLGITRKTAAGDITTERVDPASAFWLGVKETWFVVDRTLAYIGGVFTGREAADQVGGEGGAALPEAVPFSGRRSLRSEARPCASRSSRPQCGWWRRAC